MSATTGLAVSRAAAALENAKKLIDNSPEDARQIILSLGDVDPAVRKGVLEARSAYATAWKESVSANLLQSLTKLAAQLKPVTAESLNVCAQDSSRTVRAYWTVAIVLAIFIVPFSLASFVTSAISDTIRKDITTANELAVKLNSQLQAGTPKAPASPGACNES